MPEGKLNAILTQVFSQPVKPHFKANKNIRQPGWQFLSITQDFSRDSAG